MGLTDGHGGVACGEDVSEDRRRPCGDERCCLVTCCRSGPRPLLCSHLCIDEPAAQPERPRVLLQRRKGLLITHAAPTAAARLPPRPTYTTADGRRHRQNA